MDDKEEDLNKETALDGRIVWNHDVDRVSLAFGIGEEREKIVRNKIVLIVRRWRVASLMIQSLLEDKELSVAEKIFAVYIIEHTARTVIDTDLKIAMMQRSLGMDVKEVHGIDLDDLTARMIEAGPGVEIDMAPSITHDKSGKKKKKDNKKADVYGYS